MCLSRSLWRRAGDPPRFQSSSECEPFTVLANAVQALVHVFHNHLCGVDLPGQPEDVGKHGLHPLAATPQSSGHLTDMLLSILERLT